MSVPDGPTAPSADVMASSPSRLRSRRAVGSAVALLAGGAVAGGILASTLGASAASPSPSPNSAAPNAAGPNGKGPGARQLLVTGTVTAVGTDTLSIKTSTATTTYSVTSSSVIDKAGVASAAGKAGKAGNLGNAGKAGNATIADIAVGDTVFFTTTTQGGTVIAHLHDGKLPERAVGGPGFRGPGGFAAVKPLTGTVTAVGTDTVTIKTSTATTTYTVAASTTVDKSGTTALTGVKVGDTVSFNTTIEGGTVIAHLRDGALPDPTSGGPGFGRGPGGFGGPGHPGLRGPNTVSPNTAPPSPSAAATATTTGANA